MDELSLDHSSCDCSEDTSDSSLWSMMMMIPRIVVAMMEQPLYPTLSFVSECHWESYHHHDHHDHCYDHPPYHDYCYCCYENDWRMRIASILHAIRLIMRPSRHHHRYYHYKHHYFGSWCYATDFCDIYTYILQSTNNKSWSR